MDKLVKRRFYIGEIEVATKFNGAYDLADKILKIDGILKTVDGLSVSEFKNEFNRIVWGVEIDADKNSISSLTDAIQKVFIQEFGFALRMVISISEETILSFDGSHNHLIEP